jgi:hypothetical protein
MIEGLPGTGKTTIAEWLNEYLNAKGTKSILLLEGNRDIPCDFYEMAGIPNNEFKALFNDLPETFEKLCNRALVTENYAYLRIDECPEDVAVKIKRWDMGDENNQTVTVSDYVPCALERLDYWVNEVISNSGTVIVDSGFLQNPINELLFRKATYNETFLFIQEIFQRIKALNPICVYLHRNNTDEAISFAKEVKGKTWAERVDNLLIDNNCKDLFNNRFDLEQELLPLVKHIKCIPNGYDWSLVKKCIEDYFSIRV